MFEPLSTQRQRQRRIALAAGLILLLATWSSAPHANEIEHLMSGGPSDSSISDLLSLELHESCRMLSPGSIEVGEMTFEFHTGDLKLMRTAEGHTYGAVFEGEASMRLTTRDPVELAKLRVSTGEQDLEELRDDFEEAVFLFSGTVGQRLLSQSAPVNCDEADVDTDIAEDLIEEVADTIHATPLTPTIRVLAGESHEHFLAIFDGEEHGETIAGFDETGFSEASARQVGLLKFRWKGDVWYLGWLDSERDSSGSRLVDVRSVDVFTEIDRRARMTGAAEILFESRWPGLRVLHLRVDSKLRVSNAVSIDEGFEGDGTELTYVQGEEETADALLVILPDVVEVGQTSRVRIEYEGKGVIRDLGEGAFFVGSRSRWYPNPVAWQDRMSFTLEFCHPAEFRVVSVGRKTDESKDGDQRCSTWRTPKPVKVAGFSYGTLAPVPPDETAPHVNVYFHQPTHGSAFRAPSRSEGVLGQAIAAMDTYSSYFGEFPFGQLAFTYQPAPDFGQAWPSLVYLPSTVYSDRYMRRSRRNTSQLRRFVEQVAPHEVAHQWWGHWVSQADVADHWFIEGFPQFGVGLFVEVTKGAEAADEFWEDARKTLTQKRRYVLNDVGPLALGPRLHGPRSKGATRLMYDKGAYVLHMLRIMMQTSEGESSKGRDHRFKEMVREFVESHASSIASTQAFQQTVEAHMTEDMDVTGTESMDWFFDQWVRGTAIPDRYRTEFSMNRVDAGIYQIEGTVEQVGVPDDFVMPVALYVQFEESSLSRRLSPPVIVKGSDPTEVDLEFRSEKTPRSITVNDYHDILTRE